MNVQKTGKRITCFCVETCGGPLQSCPGCNGAGECDEVTITLPAVTRCTLEFDPGDGTHVYRGDAITADHETFHGVGPLKKVPRGKT